MGFAYKFHDPDSVYFVTCATVQWADVFTRSIYSDIVVDSLQYFSPAESPEAKPTAKRGLCDASDSAQGKKSPNQKPPVLINLNAIGPNFATVFHIGNHIPVHGALVLPATLLIALPHGHVYAAANFFIK